MTETDPEVLREMREPARHMEGEPVYAVAQEGPVLQEEEAYKYRLKAPTFTGREDVEQVYSRI